MCTCECAELRIHGWMHTCLSCFLFLFLKVSHQFPVFLLKNNNNSKPPFYPDINPYFKESTKYDRLLIFRASSLFLLWNIKSDICKHVHAVFFLYKKKHSMASCCSAHLCMSLSNFQPAYETNENLASVLQV